MNEVQEQQNNLNTNYASFFKRMMASFLDSTLSFCILLGFNLAGLSMLFPRMLRGYAFDVVNMTTVIAIVFTSILLASIVNLVHTLVILPKLGGTVGKLLYGAKVLNSTNDSYLDVKTAFWRQFAGYQFSAQFLGLGFFSMLKDPRKLTWHDHMFDTKVVNSSGNLFVGLLVTLLFWGLMGFLIYQLVVTGTSTFNF